MTHVSPLLRPQHFIVIGNPIAHSKSPAIHQHFAQQVGLDIRYARQFCPDNADSFAAVVDAFFNGGGIGANVTVPFKEMAYQRCHTQGTLSAHATVAGAVNTLMLQEGRLHGDNTDGQGLVNHLHQLGWGLDKTNVAIIGAGGATRGIILPLLEAGVATVTIANRTLSKAEQLVVQLGAASALIQSKALATTTIEQLTGNFDILINATSIGLSDATLPLSDELCCEFAYDLMYGRELPFLTHFAKQGAQVSDGYGMLIGQAALSFEQWTAKKIALPITL